MKSCDIPNFLAFPVDLYYIVTVKSFKLKFENI